MTTIQEGKAHILVVDDQDDIRTIIQRVLEKNDFTCFMARDGDEALDIIRNTPIDVVIADIKMPGINGIDLTSRIKREYNADVIIMTGFTKDFKYEEIIEKGASDFMQKPIGAKEILVRLNRVLKERALLKERNRAEEELKQSVVKLKKVLDATVNSLASALGKRDPFTAGHQVRVSALGSAIANRLGLPEDQVKGVQIAGSLHDIGKIAVPSEILSKPSKLSIHEFNLIKEHPLVGYEILKNIDFDQPIAQTVLQHHEKIDGSGYPQRLTQNDIILQAKILAVSDTIEGMTFHRPYRPALGIDAALEEVYDNRNKLYDAEIVGACMQLFKDNEFKFSKI